MTLSTTSRLLPPFALVSLLVLGACAGSGPPSTPRATLSTPPGDDETASVVRATTTAPMYPEGIAYDAASDTFLVGSVRAGAIGRIDRQGRYRRFVDAPELVSSVGLFVDAPRHRLLVAVGDVGAATRSSAITDGHLARLVEIDLRSGTVTRSTDFHALPGNSKDERHLANDVAADEAGNVYVTDSFAPVVYRLDPNGRASIFARSPLFEAPEGGAPGNPNLNGIVAHPHGFLLVAHWASGRLLRIPLNDPSRAHVVAEGLDGADGLVLRSDDELVVIRNGAIGRGDGSKHVTGSATLLTSSDGWQTARVGAVGTGDSISVPTTAALRNGQIWTLNFPYDEFFADPKRADRREIVLSRVRFTSANPERSTFTRSAP